MVKPVEDGLDCSEQFEQCYLRAVKIYSQMADDEEWDVDSMVVVAQLLLSRAQLEVSIANRPAEPLDIMEIMKSLVSLGGGVSMTREEYEKNKEKSPEWVKDEVDKE